MFEFSWGIHKKLYLSCPKENSKNSNYRILNPPNVFISIRNQIELFFDLN